MGVVKKWAIFGSLVIITAIALSGCAATPRPSAASRASATSLPKTPEAPTPVSPSAVPSATALASPAQAPPAQPAPTKTAAGALPPRAGFDRTRHSTEDPTSIWVVSNKLRPLQPESFVPADLVQAPVPHQNPPTLRSAASEALVALFAAAKSQGAGTLQLQSAYRSYAVQVRVYTGYVASLGTVAADAQSARPGYSEHQTGLAVDISASPANCTLAACFGATPQGKWLAANSWRFGYILRYPGDKTAVTGYVYEPWHFRYVGVELATEMHTTGVTTLEEFFRLPAAANYAG